MATIHACSSTTDLVLDVLARMSYWVPDRRDEVLSLGAAGQNSGIVTGRQKNGDPFLMMFPGMGGGPARFEVDGIDTNGHQMGAPIFAIPNVETLESRTPTLFVWRRESRDSAGPGQWRGGTGIEFAITPHRSAAALDLIVFSTHRRSPASRGVFGGMPAALQTNVILRGTQPMSLVEGRDAPLPADPQPAAVEVLPGKARVALDHGDVWISSQSGGGGLGDPLFRDPEAVVRDLRDGICSPEYAERHHGVILAGDVLDIMASDALRSARLAERRSGRQPDHTDKPIDAKGIYSNRHGTRLLSCHDCGAAFEVAGEVKGAPAVVVPWDLQAATTINKWAPDSIFLVEMYCCPGCGRCHDVGVSLRHPTDQNVALDF
jgi:N-methylhydantoinase B